MPSNQYFWRIFVAVVLLITGLVLVVQAALPRGWLLAGTKPSEYEVAVAFDNMENRAIKGTTGWQRYDVVLDVPKDATAISFGILLAGSGVVWLNGTKFEVVGADVPITNTGEKVLPEKPINLKFAD